MKFILLIDIKIPIILTFLLLELSMKLILLTNIKMPTVVGILIFISKINISMEKVL